MISSIFNTLKTHKKYLFTHFTLSLLVFAYYIFSAAHYADDYERIYSENAWIGTNRYLATIFYNLLSAMNFNMSSVPFLGPFFNILAIASLSISAILLMNHFFVVNYTNTLLALIITLLPFFNEGILYRYDSFVCMTLPFLLITIVVTNNFKTKKIELIAIALVSYLIMSLYQPAINIFITMLVIIALFNLVRGVSLKTIFCSFFIKFSVIIAIVLSTLLLNKSGLLQILGLDKQLLGWVADRSNLDFSSPIDLIILIFTNMAKYSSKMLVTTNENVGYIGYFIMLIFCSTIIYKLIITVDHKQKPIYIALSVAFLITLFFAPTAMMLISASYVFAPRYFSSWLIIAMFGLIYINSNLNFKKNCLNRLKIITLSIFIILSATYNFRVLATLTYNHYFYMNQMTLLTTEINNLTLPSNVKTIVFANKVVSNLKNYDPYYTATYCYGLYLNSLNKYFNISTTSVLADENITKDATLVKENLMHKFYIKDDNLIIEFKN